MWKFLYDLLHLFWSKILHLVPELDHSSLPVPPPKNQLGPSQSSGLPDPRLWVRSLFHRDGWRMRRTRISSWISSRILRSKCAFVAHLHSQQTLRILRSLSSSTSCYCQGDSFSDCTSRPSKKHIVPIFRRIKVTTAKIFSVTGALK